MSNWTLVSPEAAVTGESTGEDGAISAWKAVFENADHPGAQIVVESIVIDGRKRFDEASYSDGYPFDLMVVTSQMRGDDCIAVDTEWPTMSAFVTPTDAHAAARRIITAIRDLPDRTVLISAPARIGDG